MYAAVINQKTKYNDNIVLLDLGDNQLMKLDKANFLFDSIITPYNGKAVYLYNIITSEYQVYPYEGVDDLLDIDDHLQDEGFMYVTVEECKETYNQRIDAIEVQTAATASGLMTIGMITQAWEALFVPFLSLTVATAALEFEAWVDFQFCLSDAEPEPEPEPEPDSNE
ncbi:MAG: hypothetical protein IJV55_06910 [Paludibacteraceae bacterium]|nr:hypothetical protein [Paludibacteraceae bacterium]